MLTSQLSLTHAISTSSISFLSPFIIKYSFFCPSHSEGDSRYTQGISFLYQASGQVWSLFVLVGVGCGEVEGAWFLRLGKRVAPGEALDAIARSNPPTSETTMINNLCFGNI